MGRKKTKQVQPTSDNAIGVNSLESQETADSFITEDGFFPFLRYTSVVGVHTTLIVFAVLFVPQSASTRFFGLLQDDDGSSQNATSGDSFFRAPPQTSTDRPPSQFVANLTASPVATMLCVAVGVAMLQAWWAGWLRDWAIDFVMSEKGVKSEDDRKIEKGKIEKTKHTTIIRAWVATLGASVFFHILAVLFGAPLSSHVAHTYLLAAMFACFTVFPPAYVLGVPKSTSLISRLTWTRLFAELSVRNPIERALVYPVVGTAIGCWAAAVPCALDWDRPWQAWPLPPAFGGVSGYVLGTLTALTVSDVEALAEIGRKAKREESMKIEKEESERGRVPSKKSNKPAATTRTP